MQACMYVCLQVGKQLGRQVDRYVCMQVRMYVCMSVGRQVGRQVSRQVGKQVGSQVGRSIGMQEQVCMHVDRQVGRHAYMYVCMLEGLSMHLHSFIWSFFTLDTTNVFKSRAPLLPMLVKTCLSAGWGRNIRVGWSGVGWGGCIHVQSMRTRSTRKVTSDI